MSDSRAPLPSVPSEWHRGLPAMIVACLAITILGYGFLVAKPAVPGKYREACEAALADVGLLPGGTKPVEDDREDDPLETLLDRYKVINIYLRRLSAIDPQRDWARYYTGLVAQGISEVLANKASLAFKAGDKKQSDRFQSQAQAEYKRAVDTLELLAKGDSPEALQARNWLLSHQLSDPTGRQQRLEEYATMAEQLLVVDAEKTQASLRLGQIRVYQGLSLSDQPTLDARRQWLLQARQLLADPSPDDFLQLAWLVESLDALEPASAAEFASRATQAYWNLPPLKRNSLESLSAMTIALVKAGNLQEARSFIGSKVSGVHGLHQARLLALLGDGLWRSLVCHALFPGEGRRYATDEVLELLIGIDPKSERLAELIEGLVAVPARPDAPRDTLQLAERLVIRDQSPLAAYLAATRSALEEDWPTSRTKLQQATRQQPFYAAYFSSLASPWVERGTAKVEWGKRFLEQLSREAPAVVNVWLDRIAFAIKHADKNTAKECLEIVRAKSGEQRTILAIVEAFYRQLDEPAIADQVRAQIDRLGK